jgi:chromosome segregation ATPase
MWGPVMPDVERNSYDFARLERAVTELANVHRRLRDEHVALQRDVAEKDLRIRLLDEKILDANQRRSDVTKRVDELIAQIDQLEGQLGSLEPE